MPLPFFVVFNAFHHLDSLGLFRYCIGHIYEIKPVERNYVVVCVSSCQIMRVLLLMCMSPGTLPEYLSSVGRWIEYSLPSRTQVCNCQRHNTYGILLFCVISHVYY